MAQSWHKFLQKIFILGVILAAVFGGSSAQRRLNLIRKSEQDIINSILSDDYDPRINPGGNDTAAGPTTVEVNMYVRNIEYIDSAKEEMKVHLTFRRQWVDSRLSYPVPRQHKDLKLVHLEDSDKIWTPDLFISNEKEAKVHDFTQRNQYVRIFPNGDVLQSQRVTATLTCPQALRAFPFDTQVCSIRIASYAQTTRDVVLTWKQADPVQVKSEPIVPFFSLKQLTTDHCDSTTNTGTYSCLLVDFTFKRHVSYYLIQVFIPCTMLVIMAWLAFWLDPKALVSRMTLVVAALALLVIGVSRLNERVPNVSYTKAIDWWTGICMTFVFFAVIETVIANYWTRSAGCNGGQQSGCNRKANCEANGEETKKLMEDGAEGGSAAVGGKDGDVEGGGKGGKNGGVACRFQKCWGAQEGCAQKLDFIARIAYPIVFFLFVIIFFGSKMGN